jgi:hypothetical protein
MSTPPIASSRFTVANDTAEAAAKSRCCGDLPDACVSLPGSATRVRYGYRRIHVLLLREGWRVNPKRVYRLYREMGLRLGAMISLRLGESCGCLRSLTRSRASRRRKVRKILTLPKSITGYASTLDRIQGELEQAGIEFIENDDVGGFGIRF